MDKLAEVCGVKHSRDGFVSFATAQGPRSYQEDRYVVYGFNSPTGHYGFLLAVMDGHGGYQVAEFCREQIPAFFTIPSNGDFGGSLRNLIALLSRETQAWSPGSTISVACVVESQREAFVAVLGDSPVIILNDNGEVVTSPEHNVRTNREEMASAVQRGGEYERGYIWNPANRNGLQMSRALGDSQMGEIISREPEIYSVKLGRESFVLVASDGLLDPAHETSDVHAQAMVRIARDERSNAATLLGEAGSTGLQDNATVLLWRNNKN